MQIYVYDKEFTSFLHANFDQERVQEFIKTKETEGEKYQKEKSLLAFRVVG